MNAKTLAVALVALAVLLPCPLRADWDGTMTYMMHYPQMPDETNGAVQSCTDPHIHAGADDFYATCTWGITDIHIWGIWLNDKLPTRPDGTPDPAYVSFTLAIYSNVPGIPGPYAPPTLPGQKLWEKQFSPSMFKVRPWKQDANAHPWWPGAIWQYNFSIPLDSAFVQQAGTVYWLSVHADPLDASNATDFGRITSVSPQFGGWLVQKDSPTGPWYNVSDQAYDLSFVIAGRLAGDTNGDGCVDVIDLLEFIAAFGSAPGYPNYDPACDFNGDQAVDVIDLLFMIDYFGDCGPCEP